jgi:hypothetical protein
MGGAGVADIAGEVHVVAAERCLTGCTGDNWYNEYKSMCLIIRTDMG